jgi:hypothetical protein
MGTPSALALVVVLVPSSTVAASRFRWRPAGYRAAAEAISATPARFKASFITSRQPTDRAGEEARREIAASQPARAAAT